MKKLPSLDHLMKSELPATMPSTVVDLPRSERAVSPGDDQLSVRLPAEVVRAVKVRAAEDRTTLRAIVLQGLKAIGFDVPEAEIKDRRIEANARRR